MQRPSLRGVLALPVLTILFVSLSACSPGVEQVMETPSVDGAAGNQEEATEESVAESAETIGCGAFVDDGEQFIAARDVYAAIQDPACSEDILFVDARPTLDFEFGHIPNAVNVPYHSTEAYFDELPLDKWLVIYCECPHAEAVQAANALTGEGGFTQVKVIDEGLGGWREVGGETVTGAPESSEG